MHETGEIPFQIVSCWADHCGRRDSVYFLATGFLETGFQKHPTWEKVLRPTLITVETGSKVHVL